MKLVSEARNKIEEGNFKRWKEQMIIKLSERFIGSIKTKIIDRYIIRKFLGTFSFAFCS